MFAVKKISDSFQDTDKWPRYKLLFKRALGKTLKLFFANGWLRMIDG
jgi:hypothetical protein